MSNDFETKFISEGKENFPNLNEDIQVDLTKEKIEIPKSIKKTATFGLLSKEELQIKLTEYFEENFPEESANYDLRVISSLAIDPNSDFVKRTVLDFQLAFNSDKYDSTSNLFMACEQLAEGLDEDTIVQELKTIWNGQRRGMSIPDMEYLILKGIKGGLVKEYSIDGEIFTLSGLNRLLKNNKRDIYQIFGKIQKLYNIKPADFDWSKQISKSDANVSFDDLKI